MNNSYRGRFAPSPTGPLHLGSMLTAVGSYLQAKHHNGKWLVRIEDLDPAREIPGSANNMLHSLENFGLYWDEEVSYQSRRYAHYENALEQLKQKNITYACSCSRKIIRESGAKTGKIGLIYPGTCRHKKLKTNNNTAIRISVPDINLKFDDLLQGFVQQNLAIEIGDIIIKRADQAWAYQLAVVVDDYLQNITEIVRGYDLLNCTPIQLFIQKKLNYKQPGYIHLPILINTLNQKLSKQTGAKSIENDAPAAILLNILKLLNQQPPIELEYASKHEILDWAIKHWNLAVCKNQHITIT